MSLPESLLFDVGSYASAFALFTAWVCHRANPRRAANRAVVRFLATISVWQALIAVSHVAIDERFWAFWCSAAAVLAVVQLYLLHDTCVTPRNSLATRLRQSRLAWLIAGAVLLGSITKVLLPELQAQHPILLKSPAFAAIVLGLLELRTRSRASESLITAELQFFYTAAVFFAANYAVVLLFPGPVSSRVNSVITIAWLAMLTARLIRDRVFEVGRTTEWALAYVVRTAIVLLVLVPLLYAARITVAPLWDARSSVAVIAVMLVYPAAVASDVSIKFLVQSFPIGSEAVLRRRAMELLRTANSSVSVIPQIQLLARSYSRGLEVTIEVDERVKGMNPAPGLGATLKQNIRTEWLTPQNTCEQFSGADLEATLMEFRRAKLGAVVRYAGRHADIYLSVQQRQGGLKPIRPRELRLLYELATVVGTSMDRLRAIEESIRARQLATTGRLAADFSHSARNQIAAILALVEAVKNGDAAQLTPEYRDAVYQETLALAANHNMADEIARLDGNRLDRHAIELGSILTSVSESYGQLVDKVGGKIHVSVADPVLQVSVDDRLFRHVLLNLLRNSLQACTGTNRAPNIAIHTVTDGDAVYIDVVDNGPGVTAAVFDRLFTPWATTKADGTGLGLVFCVEAMRTLGGTIKYLTPRGHEHARFRLELPIYQPALVA